MGGGYEAPDPQPAETTTDMLKAYNAAAPEFLQTSIDSIMPYEEAVLSANKQLLPQYNELTQQLYAKYGPEAARIADQIAADSARSRVAAQTDILKNQGAESAQASLDVAKVFDPQYYSGRDAASTALNDLINSYDIKKGLSGSEAANVERGLNRMNDAGGTDVASNMNNVSNAFQFDDRLQAKKSGLAQAMSLVPSMLGSFKSGIDPGSVVGQAFYTPNASGSVQTQANTGATSNALLGNLLNSATTMSQSQNQYNASTYGTKTGADQAGYKSIMDQVSQGVGLIGQVTGAAGGALGVAKAIKNF